MLFPAFDEARRAFIQESGDKDKYPSSQTGREGNRARLDEVLAGGRPAQG